MSIINKIEQDFKKAMLAKNHERVNLLRLLRSALKNKAINLKKQELLEEEVLKVLKKEVKKRKDAIQLYQQGNRQDLAEKEQKELNIIKNYLPEEMDEKEIRKIVKQIIFEMKDSNPRKFGQIMSMAMSKIKGHADGAVVSRIVKEFLNK